MYVSRVLNVVVVYVILCHVSAQNAVTPSGVPVGSASLAFVFDITGSMYDDLVQVIEGAAKILATTLARREKPLYNYVLVPFHDPEVGPVLITTDPDKFQRELRDLYVQGGGDCPEMSVTAIKEALDASLPNSFIYVFTDARSKDFDLTNQVLALIQQKQSQVVFVLTGDCGDTSHLGYRAFETIASTSSGQIFLLKKNQVNQVLNFVRVAVQARKVNLMSVDVPTPNSQTFSIPIDSTLQEFTVSVSGDKPKIELIDPTGNRSSIYTGLRQLLNLTNVQVFNVRNPTPGRWVLFVKSDSPHTIRVTGLSSTDFVAGFSRHAEAELEDTELRPLGGVPTYLVVNTSDLDPPGRFDRVELVDLQNQVLGLHELSRDLGRPNMYRLVQPFQPPDGFFYVKLSGTDTEGFEIQRLTPTALSPRPPPRPIVVMPLVTRGYHDTSVYITCTIQSAIPFMVQWFRDGVPHGNELFYTESTNSILEVPYANARSEGYYTCNATNLAGYSVATTVLDISEPPPEIVPIQNVSVLPKKQAWFNCLVHSTVDFNITWYEPIQQKPILNSEKFRIYPNGTLMINVVGLEDEGKYICRAGNEGGFTDAGAYLRVQVPPKAIIEPAIKNFKTGETVNLTCSAQAYPAPKYYWLRENKLMIANERIKINGRFISISNMYLGDEGVYECLVKNVAGENVASSVLSYIEAPQIFEADDEILVASGTNTTLECLAIGIPAPKITWFKGDIQLRPLPSYINITDDGKLVIQGIQFHDSGQYRCVATNAAGTDSETVNLKVGAGPRITVSPQSFGSDIGTNATIPCEAIGYPPPKIYWRKDDGTVVKSGGRFTQLPSGHLFIMNLLPRDGGTYTCVVQNRFGIKEKSALLSITGIVLPVIAYGNSNLEVKVGDNVELMCILLRGNPKPSLHWLKMGTVVPVSNTVTKPAPGVLLIGNIQKSQEGEYVCVAKNIAGNSTYSVNVDVQVAPSLITDEERDVQGRFTVNEGETVTIPCRVEGDPKPYVRWYKDNEEIKLSDPVYFVTDDGSLKIYSAEPLDSATYTCKATNPIGEVEKTVTLFVQVPAIINGELSEKYVVDEGEEILLPCEVEGIPQPDVIWRRNFVLYAPESDRIRINDQGLLLSPVLIADKAIYECVATNPAGKSHKVITLVVRIPPSIREEGLTDITVHKGEPVTLICKVSGDPKPVVTWTKNGFILDISNGSHTEMDKHGSLKIQASEVTDDGTYQCVATNVAGTASRDFVLNVQAEPTLPPDLPTVTSTIESNDIILECPASGTPKPTVIWYKNDVRLTGDELGVNFLSDGSLELINTIAADSGLYHCVATNPAGSVEHSVNLKVLVPPKVIGGDRGDIPIPESHTVVANDSITLYCTVEADPAPLIKWKRNDIFIPTAEIESGRYEISEDGKELTITRSAVSDTGKYTCVATNVAGSSKKEFDLEVYVPPKIDEKKVSNENLTTQATRSLTIHCPVTGIPLPQISWYKDGEYISPSLDSNLKLYAGGLRLEIQNAHISDAGLYSCKAGNIAGTVNREFKVEVHVPPSIEQPREVQKPEVLEDNVLRLRCPASGIPRPKIRWYKNGLLLTPDPERYTFLDEGFTLEIRNAHVDDGTRFKCQAENDAGSSEKAFDVTVLVKPTIPNIGVETNPRVVVNRTVTLNCLAEGNPVPEITWYKNGVLLDVSLHKRYQILSNGRQLRIQQAQVPDGAIYTCEARNKAGVTRLDFTPKILVPTHIDRTSISKIRKVGVNSSLIIECPAFGTPPPEIMWFKDNQPLFYNVDPNIVLSNNNKTLQILKAKVSDTGRYTCRASNEAGQTEIEITVNVQVPPKISGEVITNPKVVTGETKSIYCPASGTPTPTIRWYKDGEPLIIEENSSEMQVRDGGRELLLLAVDVDDAGRYTCIASNEAGKTEEHFDLEVYVPPVIEKPLDETTEVVKGRETVLTCPAVGVPLPRIEWFREDQLLILTDRFLVLDGGRQLKILNATESDTGKYKCVASNTAGQTDVEMRLLVLVPPSIDESNTVYTPRVIVNRTVLLECAVAGIPPPTVRWLINDQPVVTDRRITLHNNNMVLQILNAQVTDTATYSCEASNDAGRLRKHFHLQILVPPHIDRSVKTNHTVKENGEARFDCLVSGIPKSSILWMKDRFPLLDFPYEGITVSDSDQRLTISNAQVEDALRYTCQATNAAGQDSLDYYLSVHVIPVIENAGEVQSFTLIEGDPVVLECPVTGIPDPLITWSRDNAIIVLSQNSHIEITTNGQVLRIPVTRVSDSARYTCRAENEAGWDEKSFNVEVIVPPRINSSELLQEKSVILGHDLVLECPALGVPPPDITWLWQGAKIPQNSRFFKIEDRGQRLILVNSDRPQEGFYTCIVNNVAGRTSRNFTVTVLVPPRITDDVTERTGTVDEEIILPCEFGGFPMPIVSWKKDGANFPLQSPRHSLSIGDIVFSRLRLNDEGRYTCTVTNLVGSDSKTIDLRLQVPPSITSPRDLRLQVLQGHDAYLPCDSVGKPVPTITWSKGFFSRLRRNAYTFPNGTLRLSRVGLQDSGVYTCTASNPLNFESVEVRLRVLVPPTITASQSQFQVQQGQKVTLPCHVRGRPYPKITWRRNGEIVDSSISRYYKRRNKLVIASTRAQDAGTYICTAENVAGSTEVTRTLTILVPPHIEPGSRLITGSIGDDRTEIPCQASGVPKPEITWFKDGQRLRTDGFKFIKQPAGTLVITNLEATDVGNYKCEALNIAGNTTIDTALRVYEPPVIVLRPVSQEVILNGRIQLLCGAKGSPTPALRWEKNGYPAQDLQRGSGRSLLIVNDARRSDAGLYKCIAENIAGRDEATATIIMSVPPRVTVPDGNAVVSIAEKVMLTCSVGGDPQPAITWTKNGRTVELTDRIQVLANGSLVIYDATSSDAGEYKCVATNDAGTSEGVAMLTVNEPPLFKIEPKNTIVNLGDTMTMNCVAEGEPEPMIAWQRNWNEIIPHGRLSILPNNSLRIIATQLEDSGKYQCKASNQEGITIVEANLTVVVHGRYSDWSDWGICSSTCGLGIQFRARTCTNPEPVNGGRQCIGASLDSRTCIMANCPRDGEWGNWGIWEECSTSCGPGERKRTRSCDNPAPQFGGTECQGTSIEYDACAAKPCPLHGRWSAWSSWSHCDVTCGDGFKERIRSCDSPSPRFGGNDCSGESVEKQECRGPSCEIDGAWGMWSEWSRCSLSCGGGTRSRSRECDNPVPRFGGRLCSGRNMQIDYCNPEACPFDGNWAAWGEWGACSVSCNGGLQKRFRTCSNPKPSPDGRFCAGSGEETTQCNIKRCPVHGLWEHWSSWSECSATCDNGYRERQRVCKIPLFGGQPCPGDREQRDDCFLQACSRIPTKAAGNLVGFINNIDITDATINATIRPLDRGGMVIDAIINEVPPSISGHIRHLVDILNPVFWTTAEELDGASNGFTLTKGVFVRELQVQYPAGEILKISQYARGVDSDGVLQADVIVRGTAPDLATGSQIYIAPYREMYIQTGEDTIYAQSSRLFRANGNFLPYAWNNSVKYNVEDGKMPFLVQELQIRDINTNLDPSMTRIKFNLVATIRPGSPSNQCPQGFDLDADGQYCIDDDECSRLQPCSHYCHNSQGGFSCSCPFGFVLAGNGRNCQDIDECRLDRGGCTDDRDCINTLGSFHCAVRCESGFRRSLDGQTCTDIDECHETPEVCGQECKNIMGGYQCSCSRGFRLRNNGRCTDIHECRQGLAACSHICRNTIGSYKCACPPGFRLHNRNQCVDVNECIEGSHNCNAEQECTNTEGSYKCIKLCPAGYQLVGRNHCQDIDECRTNQHQCYINQKCINNEGSYTCQCDPGYRSRGPGQPCLDLNECQEYPGVCAYKCINTFGGYECICGPGQIRLTDKKSCAGLEFLEPSQVFSVSLPGSRHQNDLPRPIHPQLARHRSSKAESPPCGVGYRKCTGWYRGAFRRHRAKRFACLPGSRYIPTHHECIDIDECTEDQGICQHACTNTMGSFKCSCPPGYKVGRNGRNCVDINECLDMNVDCGIDNMCFNTRGDFQCIETPCPRNYKRNPRTGYCVLECSDSDVPCPPGARYADVIEFKTVALPSGIPANQDLIKLTAYNQDDVKLEKTDFIIIKNDPAVTFQIKPVDGSGIVSPLEAMDASETYRITVRARSYDNLRENIQYQTTFIIHIAVSAFPY